MKYIVVTIASAILLGLYWIGGYILYDLDNYTYTEKLNKVEKRDWGGGYMYDVEEWEKKPNGLERSSWFYSNSARGFKYKFVDKIFFPYQYAYVVIFGPRGSTYVKNVTNVKGNR